MPGFLDYIRAAAASPSVAAQAQVPAASSGAVSLSRTLALADLTGLRAAPVTRDLAMSIPAMAACRNLIAGTVSQLEVQRFRGTDVIPPGQLLRRPCPDYTWATLMEWVVDDLLFYGYSALLVIARDGQATQANPDGLPVRVRRVPPEQVERLESDHLSDYMRTQGYRINGTPVDTDDVIWLEAGHDGILTYGARALRAAWQLEEAAARFSQVELPSGVLINEGAELGPDEAAQLLAGWSKARQERTTAFLQGVRFERTDLSPHDLTLNESRALTATEIARLANVPVAMISASPSGNAATMTYANLAMQTAAFIKQAVAPMLTEIEQALSHDQVTAHGQRVAFDVSGFLRTDPEASVAYATNLHMAGLISTQEARSFLGLGPIDPADPPTGGAPGAPV